LSEADINRMVKEAESHASEDKKRRELVETRNQSDALIHTAEKTLKELGDKVAAGDKSKVEADVVALRSAMEGEDVAAMKSKMEALAQSSMKIGEALYKQQAGAAAGPEAAGTGTDQPQQAHRPGDDNVVDADFEEVDENKKKNKSA
jgi:molecular chaperone DnaK